VGTGGTTDVRLSVVRASLADSSVGVSPRYMAWRSQFLLQLMMGKRWPAREPLGSSESRQEHRSENRDDCHDDEQFD